MNRIVITDVTSKVGLATAEYFCRKGWTVAGCGRDRDAADKISAMFKRGADGEFYYLEGDITNHAEIASLRDFVMENAGGVDAIFNNAETRANGELHLISEEKWDEVFATNLGSIHFTAQALIPTMIENGGGTIVNNASLSGLQADYGMAAYCAAQGGVVNLTRAMALDYGKFNIRVNAICAGAETIPGFLGDDPALLKKYSEVNPLHKVGTPEECARAVYYLASDESSHCNGVLLPITGGLDVQTGHPRNEGMA